MLKSYKVLEILQKNWLKDYNALKECLSDYYHEIFDRFFDELKKQIKHDKKMGF